MFLIYICKVDISVSQPEFQVARVPRETVINRLIICKCIFLLYVIFNNFYVRVP